MMVTMADARIAEKKKVKYCGNGGFQVKRLDSLKKNLKCVSILEASIYSLKYFFLQERRVIPRKILRGEKNIINIGFMKRRNANHGTNALL